MRGKKGLGEIQILKIINSSFRHKSYRNSRAIPGERMITAFPENIELTSLRQEIIHPLFSGCQERSSHI